MQGLAIRAELRLEMIKIYNDILLRGDRIGEDRRINGLSLLFLNDQCHGKQNDIGDFLES